MEPVDLVFWVDVDNTLLDNDRVKAELAGDIARLVGPERAAHFWALYEEVRREEDFVDFPRTLHLFREAYPDQVGFYALTQLLIDYPFHRALYPGALAALAHLKTLGTVVIVTDGDALFQPHKIEASGIGAAADGNVLVYVHKERVLDRIQARYPARHYVLIDDKPGILARAKERLGDQLTSLFVRQGLYAREQEGRFAPGPDRAVNAIADLAKLTRADFPTGG